MDFQRFFKTLKENALMLFAIPVIPYLTFGQIGPYFSIALVDFRDMIGCSSAAIGLAHSVYVGLRHVLGPLVIILTNRLGSKFTIILGCTMTSLAITVTSQTNQLWQIFISHSLLGGCGTCILLQSVVYVIGHKYDKSATLFYGLLYSGISVGFFVTPLIFSKFRTVFGWQGTILIIGSMSMNSIPISLLVFRDHTKRKKQRGTKISTTSNENNVNDTSSCEDATNISIPRLFLKFPRLSLLTFVRLTSQYSFIGFFVHFSASIRVQGFPEDEVALVFLTFGIGSLLGRLSTFLPEYTGICCNYNAFTVAMFISGVTIILFRLSNTVTYFMITACVFGMSCGFYIALIPVVTRSCVPMHRFKHAYSISGIPTGIMCIMGGYVTGLIYDFSGSYNISFVISGCFYILNGSLMFVANIIPRIRTSYSKNQNTHKSVRTTSFGGSLTRQYETPGDDVH